MRDAAAQFDELMECIDKLRGDGGHRNLTAAVRYYWHEFEQLVGRNRPYTVRDAAAALHVPRRSLETAVWRIQHTTAQRPGHGDSHAPSSGNATSERADEGNRSAVSEVGQEAGCIERSPYFRPGDRADYTRGCIARRDRDFGWVHIDPVTGAHDYSL